ncbi:hypothetical protein QJS04_geneDACA021487 [Acorus gramineus]|uniref:Uncharacterized protein n=1 Tax=Acorus gramineus TaxID=55184 RepID=A0AAV9A5N7_ACOGR|nr:hypothetical protein QJS04_geneDACA021487 [Acorus gramineus]
MVEKTAVGGGGGGGDDVGDGMVCSEHPYSGGNPGGICAFCLQEKLGKLVSSSKSSSPFFSSSSSILPPSSSSSSPSFRSDAGNGGAGGGSESASASRSARPRIPFFSTQSSFYQHQNSSSSTNTKKKPTSSSSSTTTTSASDAGLAVLKRSRSVAPRPLPAGFLPDASGTAADGSMDSPRRRRFWSFLHLSRTKRTAATTTATTISRSDRHPDSTAADHGVASTTIGSVKTTTKRDYASEATAAGGGGGGESPSGSQSSSSASFGRKVARSKSVGCGSRSFSGDFLERISTGFGDCTLRRVESQREAKPKVASLSHHRVSTAGEDERMKERVRCGGIFGGFGMISSSSYSYWFSDDFNGGAGGAAAARVSSSSSSMAASGGGAPHGRSWSWGWAFASPMRAFRTSSFSTTTTATNKHHHHHPYLPPTKTAAATSTSSAATTTTTTPKLAGVPSLLAVNGNEDE